MSETATRNGAATARRAGVDRDAVVDAALALVEAEGADALTMRRLAADLHVTTTTIYWHVGGRDELVAALIRRFSERLAEREVVGDTPAERVLDVARHMWDGAMDHPHVARLAHQVGATSRLELPLQVAMVRELEAAGLRGAAVRDALRACTACVAGFLVVALRPDESVPPEYRAEALWADVDTTGITKATRDALARHPTIKPLFETTMAAVVADVLSRAPETR